MKFGNYLIDTIFLIFAAAFLIIAMTFQNISYIGVAFICLIFGVKKIKADLEDDPKNNQGNRK